MKNQITDFVAKCKQCQACKPGKTITPELKPKPVLMPRFQDLQLDVVGPLEPSNGHRYLLTIICRTSRFMAAVPMTAATSANCVAAFLEGWVQHFGLPAKATSDSRNVFISQIWRELQKELGTIVEYSPLYSPSSLGAIERIHRDLKIGIKTTLMNLADTHKEKWMSILPWTLLARRTAYHSELQASPAEVLFGENPAVPGDLPAADIPADHDLADLLDRVRNNARRPPAQTSIRRDPPVYYPPTTQTATHVYLRQHKTTPLSPISKGPYEIIERLGKSTIKIKVGSFKSGAPRTEVHHWKNCTPYILPEGAVSAQKESLGRKPKSNTVL